jgi:hypothetical protein
MLSDLAANFSIEQVSNTIVAQSLRKNGIQAGIDRIAILEEFLADENPVELLKGLQLLPALDGREDVLNCCQSFYCHPKFWTLLPPSQKRVNNRGVSDKPRQMTRHQRAQAHNSTLYRQQHTFMYWLCTKQNCLLCPYECDFGDNDIIPIV